MNFAKRAVLNAPSASRVMAPRSMAFHASAPSRKADEEEYVAPTLSLRVKPYDLEVSKKLQAEMIASQPAGKGGLFGTGIDELYAWPLGLIVGIPIISGEYFVLSAETQVAACFMTFCLACYTQGGDAIREMLEARAQAIVDEHAKVEDLNIEAMKEVIEAHKKRVSMVEDLSPLLSLRTELISKISDAKSMQLKYDTKTEIENKLNMLVLAEINATEKTKASLVEEASSAVTASFVASKAAKKAALDVAIASIKGTASKAKDPVQEMFSKFFQTKIADAKANEGKTVKLSAEDHASILADMKAFAKKEGLDDIEVSYPKAVPMYK